MKVVAVKVKYNDRKVERFSVPYEVWQETTYKALEADDNVVEYDASIYGDDCFVEFD